MTQPVAHAASSSGVLTGTPDLQRQIGPVLATLLVANNMIGSGVFLLPATLGNIGSITVLGWLVATVGAIAIALVLAQLGMIRSEPGGHCGYVAAVFGPRIGFQAYLVYWICCVIGNLAIALAAVGYLASFFPMLAQGMPLTVTCIAFIVGLTALNVVGPRFVCQFDSLALVAGLIPILLVATWGWAYFNPDLFAANWNIHHTPFFKAVPQSLVLVFWAFLGLESAAVATTIVRSPERNVPIATVGGVLLAAMVYIAASSAIFGIVPASQLAASTAPFADAAATILGPIAGSLVAIAALIKATGTLAGWLLVTAETGQAAAKRRIFPPLLARTDRRAVPVLNLTLTAALMCLMTIANSSPTLAAQFSRLIEVSVILALISYLYACAALLRIEAPRETIHRPYIYLVTMVSAVFCIGVIAASPLDQVAIGAGIVAIAIALYPLLPGKQTLLA